MNLDEFKFSFNQVHDTKQDLNNRVDALEKRIVDIDDRVKIGDQYRVVNQLLASFRSINATPEDIVLIGKALQRVGELLPELEELKKRRDVIELSLEDKNWFVATFADLTNEFPDELSQEMDIDNLP